MEAGGVTRGWYIIVTVERPYSVAPPQYAFVLRYDQYSSRRIVGTLADAEEHMFQIIGDLRGKSCDPPLETFPTLAIVAGLAIVCIVAHTAGKAALL